MIDTVTEVLKRAARTLAITVHQYRDEIATYHEALALSEAAKAKAQSEYMSVEKAILFREPGTTQETSTGAGWTLEAVKKEMAR